MNTVGLEVIKCLLWSLLEQTGNSSKDKVSRENRPEQDHNHDDKNPPYNP